MPVRVEPRARRNEVVGWRDGVLRVRVTAAPAGGEANRAVREVLARALRVPASRIALVRGGTVRDKLFRIDGFRLAELRARLTSERT